MGGGSFVYTTCIDVETSEPCFIYCLLMLNYLSHTQFSRFPHERSRETLRRRRLIKLFWTKQFFIQNAVKSNRATLRGATANLCFGLTMRWIQPAM